MVLSTGKIPGFSGTDFKNRKGFECIKEIHDRESRIENTGGRKWEKPKSYSKLKFFRIALSMFSIVGLVFIFSTFVIQLNSKLGDYSTNHHLIVDATTKRMESEKLEKAFSILMHSATGLLTHNYFEDAQREAVLALKIKPNDPKANLVMTEILVKKCQFHQTNCDDALAYLAALPHLEGVDEKEIMRLKTTFKK